MLRSVENIFKMLLCIHVFMYCCFDNTAAAYMKVYADKTLTYDMSQTVLQYTYQYSVTLIMLYRLLLLLLLPVKDSNRISIYMC
jgi:hypothetical protein